MALLKLWCEPDADPRARARADVAMAVVRRRRQAVQLRAAVAALAGTVVVERQAED